MADPVKAGPVTAAEEGAAQPGPAPVRPTLRGVRRKCASQEDALEGLKAFVMSLGVEQPAETEAELLMQAAPYMSESLDANLQSAWTPEERARLDAAPVPNKIDHQNRDHEYIFVSHSITLLASSVQSCREPEVVELLCRAAYHQRSPILNALYRSRRRSAVPAHNLGRSRDHGSPETGAASLQLVPYASVARAGAVQADAQVAGAAHLPIQHRLQARKCGEATPLGSR